MGMPGSVRPFQPPPLRGLSGESADADEHIDSLFQRRAFLFRNASLFPSVTQFEHVSQDCDRSLCPRRRARRAKPAWTPGWRCSSHRLPCNVTGLDQVVPAGDGHVCLDPAGDLFVRHAERISHCDSGERVVHHMTAGDRDVCPE